MGACRLEPTRRLRRLSDDSRGSKNMSEPHRRSLPGPHFTVSPVPTSPLPLKRKKKRRNESMHTLDVHAHSRYPWLNSPWGYMWTQFALPIKLLTFAPECNTWFCTVLSCKAIITQAAPRCETEEAVTSRWWETFKSAKLLVHFLVASFIVIILIRV